MSRPARDDDVTIVVVRTGGFAGMRRRWQVDAAADQTKPWSALVEQCPWDAPYAPASDTDAADRFTWSIQVRIAGSLRERDLPETALTGPWRELVDAVREADGRPATPPAEHGNPDGGALA